MGLIHVDRSILFQLLRSNGFNIGDMTTRGNLLHCFREQGFWQSENKIAFIDI